MTLIERLRTRIGDPHAGSFQLMGEDAVRLTGPDLVDAARAYEAELAQSVPPSMHEAFVSEQRAIVDQASDWLHRYNRNLYTRIEGYVALGRACHFEYPWPVVAILGIQAVLDGMGRMRAFGLWGRAGARLGWPLVEEVCERIDDVLRRTNRGIFADSVPTTLYALHCYTLRRQGAADLADALLNGPLPPVFDEESRDLIQALTETFALSSGQARFSRLAELTAARFEREQAVFTHHLGERRTSEPEPFCSRSEAFIANPRRVRAPRIRHGLRGRRLVFAEEPLPPGFDIREHKPRVEVFERLFVRSVTGSLADYQTAVAYVARRYGQPEDRHVPYPDGGLFSEGSARSAR